jgi:acyl-CoA synthetase (AMP-forming)/AMP-acid ligase II
MDLIRLDTPQLLTFARWEEEVARAKFRFEPLAGSAVSLVPHLSVTHLSVVLGLLELDCQVFLLNGIHAHLSTRFRQLFPGITELDPVVDGKKEPGWLPVHGRPCGSVVLGSSGTTGTPKLLALSGSALWTSASAVTESWSSATLPALQLPLWHIAGLALALRAWSRRLSLILAPPHMLPLVGQTGPTHLSTVASQWIRWQQMHPPDRLEGLRAGLLEVLVGGGAPPVAWLEQLHQEGYPLRVSFAMSEAASTVALTPLGDPFAPYETLPHWEWRVLADRLALKGPSLASGQLTPDGLIPLADAEGWFLSQDRVSIEGKGLRWLGRADRLVSSGGEKICPVSMERWLMQKGARRAWVIGIPHPIWGERPVGFISGFTQSSKNLLEEMRAEHGNRLSCDELLALPEEFEHCEKVPREALLQLWSSSQRPCS